MLFASAGICWTRYTTILANPPHVQEKKIPPSRFSQPPDQKNPSASAIASAASSARSRSSPRPLLYISRLLSTITASRKQQQKHQRRQARLSLDGRWCLPVPRSRHVFLQPTDASSSATAQYPSRLTRQQSHSKPKPEPEPEPAHWFSLDRHTLAQSIAWHSFTRLHHVRTEPHTEPTCSLKWRKPPAVHDANEHC